MTVGRWAHGPGRLTTFDELGLDRLLIAVPAAEAAAFCEATLGALERADDRSHGTSLVATLDTFLATRNASLAARQLYLHYNTLKNRLDRIEELIGPFLDDSGPVPQPVARPPDAADAVRVTGRPGTPPQEETTRGGSLRRPSHVRSPPSPTGSR